MPQTDTFTYRHTHSQPGPPAAASFWLASFSHLLQVALVKRLWKKRQIYCLSFFVERCRKPLYLVSDWFVHLPIKYLVNEKKKTTKESFSLTVKIEMGKKWGINRVCTVSAASGYSNRSNVQARIHGTGRLNDFFYLIWSFTHQTDRSSW